MRLVCASAQNLVGGLFRVGKRAPSDSTFQFKGGGRIALDNWWPARFLDDGERDLGRGRGYRRVVIDEAAFAKDGANNFAGSAMEIWESRLSPRFMTMGVKRSYAPTRRKKSRQLLLQYLHRSAVRLQGISCNHPRQSGAAQAFNWRDHRSLAAAKTAAHPRSEKGQRPSRDWQEYLAEFVDWAGVAFFERERLLDQGQPVPFPQTCDGVFAVIDTAS